MTSSDIFNFDNLSLSERLIESGCVKIYHNTKMQRYRG